MPKIKHTIILSMDEYISQLEQFTNDRPLTKTEILTAFSKELKTPISEISKRDDCVILTVATKGHPRLSQPYTVDELKRLADDKNYIYGWVSIPFNKIVNNDFEWMLDALSNGLTGTELLSAIDYEVITSDEDNIIFYVTGDISMILETEDGES